MASPAAVGVGGLEDLVGVWFVDLYRDIERIDHTLGFLQGNR